MKRLKTILLILAFGLPAIVMAWEIALDSMPRILERCLLMGSVAALFGSYALSLKGAICSPVRKYELFMLHAVRAPAVIAALAVLFFALGFVGLAVDGLPPQD